MFEKCNYNYNIFCYLLGQDSSILFNSYLYHDHGFFGTGTQHLQMYTMRRRGDEGGDRVLETFFKQTQTQTITITYTIGWAFYLP